nr:MAG TPA: hypothetical protein [Caudoviricetes sp.]
MTYLSLLYKIHFVLLTYFIFYHILFILSNQIMFILYC